MTKIPWIFFGHKSLIISWFQLIVLDCLLFSKISTRSWLKIQRTQKYINNILRVSQIIFSSFNPTIYIEKRPKSYSPFFRLTLLCFVPCTFKNLGYEILQCLPILFKHIDESIRIPSTTDLTQFLSLFSS